MVHFVFVDSQMHHRTHSFSLRKWSEGFPSPKIVLLVLDLLGLIQIV